jgi:hypothetical protein
MSEEELKQRVQQLQADELDALERDPDITDSEKERLKKQLNSDSLIAEAKKRILKILEIKDGSLDYLEENKKD